MSIFAPKATNDTNFEKPQPGSHPAVLIGLIDLGTHLENFQGKEYKARKILLVWELTTTKMAGMKDANFLACRDFSLTTSPKSGLRKLMEGWRGRPYAEGEAIELTKALGKSCLLTIVHNKGGYAKVEGANPVPRGANGQPLLVVPPATRPQICWEIDSNTPPPAMDWLPYLYGSPIKDAIASSDEMRAKDQKEFMRDGQPAGAGANSTAVPAQTTMPTYSQAPADEVTF